MAFGKSPDDQSLLSPTGTFDQAVSNHCTTFVRYAPSISEHSVPRRRHGKWEKGFPDGKVAAPWNKMEERLRPSTAFSGQVWLPLQHNLASPCSHCLSFYTQVVFRQLCAMQTKNEWQTHSRWHCSKLKSQLRILATC